MKRLLGLIVILAMILSLPLLATGEDSKEILILKRDLAQERVLRLQAQLSLMQQQFADGQRYLQEVQKELNDLNVKLTAMEPKKEKDAPKSLPLPKEKK